MKVHSSPHLDRQIERHGHPQHAGAGPSCGCADSPGLDFQVYRLNRKDEWLNLMQDAVSRDDFRGGYKHPGVREISREAAAIAAEVGK